MIHTFPTPTFLYNNNRPDFVILYTSELSILDLFKNSTKKIKKLRQKITKKKKIILV